MVLGRLNAKAVIMYIMQFWSCKRWPPKSLRSPVEPHVMEWRAQGQAALAGPCGAAHSVRAAVHWLSRAGEWEHGFGWSHGCPVWRQEKTQNTAGSTRSHPHSQPHLSCQPGTVRNTLLCTLFKFPLVTTKAQVSPHPSSPRLSTPQGPVQPFLGPLGHPSLLSSARCALWTVTIKTTYLYPQSLPDVPLAFFL